MCLEARTDIPMAANSRGNHHLHSDGQLSTLYCLILALKDRYTSIVHLQMAKWQFREALSWQRQPHTLPTTSVSLWELLIPNPVLGLFFLIKKPTNHRCSDPKERELLLPCLGLLRIESNRITLLNHLTNLTFPEGPKIKTKLTAS